MGDTTNIILKNENLAHSKESSESSIECLRETKPAQDISIKLTTNGNENISETKTSKDANELKSETDPAKIQTVFEKLNIATDGKESTLESNISRKEVDDEVKIQLNNVNKSAIYPANSSMSTMQSTGTLYSVKGSPSGRMIRRRDISSTVFPAGCMGCKEDDSPRRFLDPTEVTDDCTGHINGVPRKRPCSAVPGPRNPVTGTGLEVDVRRVSSRRKDGNPLLGTGYEDTNSTQSSSRIPPGGYSQGLW